jgi:hypothetical protein
MLLVAQVYFQVLDFGDSHVAPPSDVENDEVTQSESIQKLLVGNSYHGSLNVFLKNVTECLAQW